MDSLEIITSKILREIKLFASLHHPNIVNYHNCWLENSLVKAKEKKKKVNDDESEASSKYELQCYMKDELSKADVSLSIDTSKKARNVNGVSRDNDDESSDDESGVGFYRQPKVVDNLFTTDVDFTPSNSVEFKATTSVDITLSDSAELISAGVVKKNSIRKKQKVKEAAKETPALTNQITLYIQMKLCDLTLKEFIQKRNENVFSNMKSDKLIYIDGNLCLNLFNQILEGVNYIHSQGIIHRDLKPSNIFLIKDTMQVKIGDFGLACVDLLNDNVNLSDITLDRVAAQPLRRVSRNDSEHTIGVGTSMYASPEQLNIKNYDYKTDMYSLGIILFELFQPFSTEMERHRSIEHLKSSNIFPEYIINEWPKQCDIIRSLLEKNPQQRPSSSSLLSNELFMDTFQIIQMLRKLIETKDNQIVELNKKLKEKDELLEQKDHIINALCGLNETNNNNNNNNKKINKNFLK